MGKILLLRSSDNSKSNVMSRGLEPAQDISIKAISVLVILIFVADQATKILAVRDLAPLGSIEIIPSFFSLTFVKNKGAAFGMFAGLPSPWREISLGVVSAIALGFVIHMLVTEGKHHRVPRLALSLILGGACGNLLDRVRYGAVVDFLDFYIGQYHWPAFNIADSSICIGVVLLLWSMFLGSKEKRVEVSSTSYRAKTHSNVANV